MIRAAAGLTAYLRVNAARTLYVIVGFDARINSDVFAQDTAAVVVAAGGRAAICRARCPRRSWHYAIRFLGADAGTSWSRPATATAGQLQGHHLGDGSRRSFRRHSEIAAHIAQVEEPSPERSADGDGWEALADDVLDAYGRYPLRVVDPAPRG